MEMLIIKELIFGEACEGTCHILLNVDSLKIWMILAIFKLALGTNLI